jgi:hypothetical protein
MAKVNPNGGAIGWRQQAPRPLPRLHMSWFAPLGTLLRRV